MEDKKEQLKTKSPVAEMEERVLAWWDKDKTFQKALHERKKKKPFVFYDGPPTANGMPHPGHVMGRCFKDLFLRYKTMKGFYVPRRAGWDTHGLPVEIEVEKTMGFRSKTDIEKFGVAAFNRACRESVWKYKNEWEKITRRIGFWLDMEHSYITYQNDYIETLWWVIARIHEKGLLLEDYKVVPYCTRCGTGLSSHEVAQGYKTVKETSVYVMFPITKTTRAEEAFHEKARNGEVFDDRRAHDAKEYFLVWTTTPWTLPANVALAVNPSLEYVRARKDDTVFVLAKERLAVLGDGWEVLQTLKGKELAGVEYKQMFNYLKPDKKAFFVVGGDFVSAEDGSGIVHLAPAYGEDDMEMARKHGLPVLHPVNENGTFSAELPWQGIFVKKADPAIREVLTERGLLFKEEVYEHEYPHCWRCDTPLLYFARKSWFVKMAGLKEELLARNETINWIPDHLKEGRFGGWLKEVKDWAFSRSRYWGTPLPLWRCGACAQVEVIGSLEELKKRSLLNNRYIVMRHGESENNVKNIIDTHDEQYHLTKKGKEQVARSLASFTQKNKKLRVDLIVSSPFLRTKETALLAADALGIDRADVAFDPLLREINGGIFSGKKITEYHKYFSSIEERFVKAPPEGEHLNEVKKRLAQFVRETEARVTGKTILVVSHEDTIWLLEVMLAGFSNTEAARLKSKLKKGTAYIGNGVMRHVHESKLPLDEDGNLDVHRPYIDGIELSCMRCGGTMRRVPELADVWFDSGAMPYAQEHFPFSQKSKTVERALKEIPFPADFISEGIDQTRGWFYTLLAVSAALGVQVPYRNVLSFGHILDKEGKKMAKSKKNYTDPMEIGDRYGIDALRWFYFTVNSPGEPKRFDEKDIAEAQRKNVMVLLNVLAFLTTYGKPARKKSSAPPRSKFVLDRWIISRVHRTAATTDEAMDRYDSLEAARSLNSFFDDLTNWYVRRSRERFEEAEPTLRYVYEMAVKLVAPFTPFVAEHIWLALGKRTSVHREAYPKADKKRIDEKLEYAMIETRNIVSAALKQRSEAGVKVRQPLATLFVSQALDAGLRELIQSEVNVKEVRHDPSLSEAVRIDTVLTPELIEEGMVREAVRHIQRARKEAGLTVKDAIVMRWAAEDERIVRMMERWEAHIKERVGARRIERGAKEASADWQEVAFDDATLGFLVRKVK